MTIADPIIQQFLDHLQALSNDIYLSPDYSILDELRDALRYDENVRTDISILNITAPTILRVINSDDTTAITKKYAIEFLDIVLPYFSFDQVSNIFNEDLMVRAFHGNGYLKTVLCKVIGRADARSVENGRLLLCLFEALADSKADLSTVAAAQGAIEKLVSQSRHLQEMILHDESIVNTMKSMKADRLTETRLIDLVCELLPIVPQIPTSFYLIGKRELAESKDILFFGFTLDIWRVLLYLSNDYEALSFLSEEMKPQLDFCCRRLVGETTLIDDIEEFSELNDCGIEFLVATISFTSLGIFKQLDEKYNIIDYCVNHYKTNKQCNRFLTRANSFFLRKDSLTLYENFKLSHDHVDLFCHLLSDQVILKKYMTLENFPQSLFVNLNFEDLFQIFITLSGNNLTIEKMVSNWPIIITKVISAEIINDTVAQTNTLEKCLNEILKSGVDLGNLYSPISEKHESLKNEITVFAHDPLTETL